MKKAYLLTALFALFLQGCMIFKHDGISFLPGTDCVICYETDQDKRLMSKDFKSCLSSRRDMVENSPTAYQRKRFYTASSASEVIAFANEKLGAQNVETATHNDGMICYDFDTAAGKVNLLISPQEHGTGATVNYIVTPNTAGDTALTKQLDTLIKE